MGAACLGVPCAMKNRPALDAAYLPFAPWRDAYLKEAHRPVRIAVERQDGQVAVFDTRLRGVTDPADLRFLERTVKLLLWSVGGWRVRICGCDDLTRRLAEIYGPHGSRAFDASLMETVFRRPFTLESVAERAAALGVPCELSMDRRMACGIGICLGCAIAIHTPGGVTYKKVCKDGPVFRGEEVAFHAQP